VLLFSSSTGAINDINDGRLRGNNVPHLALGESIATADPLGLFTWRPRPTHSPTIPGPTYSPTIPGLAIMSSASLEQALLFGAWRTQSQLLEMSDGDMRTTLIVEMERISSLSISELQALSSCGNLGSLVGFSSISVFLLTRNIRTSAQLSSMDYDDQRNTLITNFVNNLGMTTTDLQALGDFDLTSVGFASNLYAGNAGSGSTTIPGPTYSPTIPGLAIMSYIGCFIDDYARDMGEGTGDPAESATFTILAGSVTIQGCANFCRDGGFDFAGLQNGSQCFCDNAFGSLGAATEAECNTPCYGDQTTMCGGPWRNSVYSLDQTTE